MIHSRVLLCAAALAGAVHGGIAAAQQITGFTHAGEGCPGGQATWSYNPATRALRLTTPSMVVDEGNPSTACNIDLVVQTQERSVLRFAQVHYLGFIDKAAGATAELRRRYQADLGAPTSALKTWGSDSAARGLFLLRDADVARSGCTNQATLGLTARMTLRGQSQGSRVSMVSDNIPSVYITLGAEPCR